MIVYFSSWNSYLNEIILFALVQVILVGFFNQILVSVIFSALNSFPSSQRKTNLKLFIQIWLHLVLMMFQWYQFYFRKSFNSDVNNDTDEAIEGSSLQRCLKGRSFILIYFAYYELKSIDCPKLIWFYKISFFSRSQDEFMSFKQ